MTVDEQYTELIRRILASGADIDTRNSRVRRIRSQSVVFDSTPLIGVRKTPWKTAIREMEWFLGGDSSVSAAHPSVKPWWEPWLTEGNLQLSYPTLFRRLKGYAFDAFDQVKYVLDGVKNHPYSRRNCWSVWNGSDMTNPDCKLTTCHNSFTMFMVDPDGTLHVDTTQRSSDVVVGLGANWIQMWAVLLFVAKQTGHKPGTLRWTGLDCHIYESHLDLAREIVDRVGEVAPTPKLVYNPSSEEFRADDFSLEGEYRPVISTKAEMVV